MSKFFLLQNPLISTSYFDSRSTGFPQFSQFFSEKQYPADIFQISQFNHHSEKISSKGYPVLSSFSSSPVTFRINFPKTFFNPFV